MTDRPSLPTISRRTMLRGGMMGLLAAATGAMMPVAVRTIARNQAVRAAELAAAPAAYPYHGDKHFRLVATDGHIQLPGRDPLYVVGFVQDQGFSNNPLTDKSISELIQTYKGKVQVSAPPLAIPNNYHVYINLVNAGLVVRPDLDDSHTIHWHGFRNPNAVFDGVPEVSIAVPVARNFPFFYYPHDEGTYMYHCHFEDVEHVQMGMNGIVYVTPDQNGANYGGFTKFAYEDGDGTTGYNREFTLMLNEIDTRPHDNLENVQEFVWTDYKPNYWIINGRSYPDTIQASGALPSQPISSLIQANAGERVLLRFANLGYEQHAMQLTGIPMKVVGEDSSYLVTGPGVNLTYMTNIIYIGPGEARDVLFTAPAYQDTGHLTDAAGNYNRYLLMNRNMNTLTNDGETVNGLGGMATEVRVYASGIPAQTVANETYL